MGLLELSERQRDAKAGQSATRRRCVHSLLLAMKCEFRRTVSILNAARNSLSFFMLCIVCMGYGIVRPSLGAVMLRVQILAVVHFAFGVLYSIGTVTIPLESAGMFLFFCVMPLAFSLSFFMSWISASLSCL